MLPYCVATSSEFIHSLYRARGRPGIDSEDSISPAYVAWRAGKTNRVVLPARQAGSRFLGALTGLQIRAQERRCIHVENNDERKCRLYCKARYTPIIDTQRQSSKQQTNHVNLFSKYRVHLPSPHKLYLQHIDDF